MSSTSSTSKLIPHTNAGSRTVEGNVSGSRAAALERQRQEQAQAFEAAKQKKAQQAAQTASLDKFRTATKQSAAEQAFSSQTVGLVTAEEFVKASSTKANAALKFLVTGDATADDQNGDDEKGQPREETPEQRAQREKAERKARKKKRKEKTKQLATLSFAGGDDDDNDDDHDEEETTSTQTPSRKKKKSKKDPTVDTSFLPDAQRDEQRQEQRRKLEQEWLEQQLLIKKQTLEITYSYWDGSGHRRVLQCSKGDSIGTFLASVINQLSKEFRNLGGLTSDELMYIKEDLIIPNDLTFYDLIATKARGKSGPLFHFDVHDDVRVGPVDVRVEKEESHPGKVVERKWYERHKHIFPASRWEVYDPSKDSYGTYTIGGK